MAIGFGSTSGAGTTDVLAYTGVPDHDVLSCAFWVWRNAAANQTFLGCDNGSNSGWFIQNTTDSTHRIITRFASTVGLYYFPADLTGEWYHLAFTHDRGVATNDPVVYVNGSAVSITTDPAGSGAYQTGTEPIRIGNNAAGDRVTDGKLAEVGLWNRILGADEIASMALISSLGGGEYSRPAYTPLMFPRGLYFYAPLVRGPQDRYSVAASVTGTAVHSHPRVMDAVIADVMLPYAPTPDEEPPAPVATHRMITGSFQ